MNSALVVKIGSDISELRAGMSKAQGLVKDFQGGLSEMASTLGLAFGVQQVATFGIELTKLAGQVDGVKQAFDKLQGSEKALNDLRAATKGTVSDFDLMKAAVQANNFKIPLDQLGSLFNFAYERAKATGQSVDYLVNSIVVGIGRKSPLILDNLGISAVELKDKLKGVSTEAATVGDVANAVGKIASEAMAQMGTSAVTASEKIAQITAKWENAKESFGAGLASIIASEKPDALLTNINNQLTVWQSNQFTFWQKLLGSAADYADMVKQIQLSQNTEPLGPSPAPALGPISKIDQTPQSPQDFLANRAKQRSNSSDSFIGELKKIQTSDIKTPILDIGNAIEYVQKKADDLNMENVRNQWEQSAISAQNMANAVAQIGDAFGQGLGAAISGTVSFGQAMAQMASQVVASLERMALAYMIENNAKFGLPGIALAAVGFGLVKSLFAKIGSGGGSGGGVSSQAQVSRSNAMTVNVVGQTQISGTQLNVLWTRQQVQNGYTGGLNPVGG